MVEILKKIKLTKANDRQKTYAATILAVTGGTLMFTAWQFIIPLQKEIPEINPIVIVFLILSSIVTVTWGYNVYKEDG